jgi:hypothetical protein
LLANLGELYVGRTIADRPHDDVDRRRWVDDRRPVSSGLLAIGGRHDRKSKSTHCSCYWKRQSHLVDVLDGFGKESPLVRPATNGYCFLNS